MSTMQHDNIPRRSQKNIHVNKQLWKIHYELPMQYTEIFFSEEKMKISVEKI